MSVISDIFEVVQTRLQALVTSGDASGVERPPKFGSFLIEDRRIIIRSTDPEEDKELGSPGNPPRVAWVLPVLVSGLVMPSDDSTDSIDSLVHDFGAVMQNAITDAADWYRFDGNAINCDPPGPVKHSRVADDSINAAEFEMRITYRVSETDQTELRG